MIKDIINNRKKRQALYESKEHGTEFYKFCPHCAKKNSIPQSLIESVVYCGYCSSDITNEPLNERFVKVIRNGEVVKKKVRTRKKILTAAQKQALRKARKKAHTSSAKRNRMKSLKKGQRMGLHDSRAYIGDDGLKYIICPHCEAHNSMPANINESANTILCGDCNTNLLNESTLFSDLEIYDAPDNMHNSLAVIDYFKGKKTIQNTLKKLLADAKKFATKYNVKVPEIKIPDYDKTDKKGFLNISAKASKEWERISKSINPDDCGPMGENPIRTYYSAISAVSDIFWEMKGEDITVEQAKNWINDTYDDKDPAYDYRRYHMLRV